MAGEKFNLGSLFSGGSSVLGALSQLHANDLNYRLQKKQLQYEKDLQNIMFQREDNAVQRRVSDLKAAGLSPTLAAGSAASSGPVVSTQTPQKESGLSSFLALAQIKTMLAEQQKAQTEADIARQSLEQSKIQTQSDALSKELLGNQVELSNLDKKYYLDRGTSPVEVGQDWQQRLVNLLYPKLEDWMFGNEDEEKKGFLASIFENSKPSSYQTFDKEIPRVKLANGDILNDYEYDVLKKKGLLVSFYKNGWTPSLSSAVYGKGGR